MSTARPMTDDLEIPEEDEVAAWPERIWAHGAVRALAAFLLFLALSILIWGHGVIGHLSSVYVSGGGDADFFRWALGWVPWALEHGRSPMFTDRVFAPDGVTLTWTAVIPGPAIVMWPITKTFGSLVSYNLLMLLAPALAAWAAYLVCNRLTHAFWPSVVGGYLFGFSTYMVGQMASHVNLVLMFPIPLVVYLVIRRLEGSLGLLTFLAGSFGVLLAMFSISTELFATAAVFGGIAFLLAIAFGPGRAAILRTAVLTGAAFLAVVAVMFVPYVQPTLRNAPSGPIRPIGPTAADALGFLVPRGDLLIGGRTFLSTSARFTARVQEDAAYLGVALVLTVIGFAITERRRRGTWPLVAFVLIASVLAMGPILHVAGVEHGWWPGALLAHAPILRNATPQRFPMYTALAVGVIAALWVARGRGWFGWVRWALVLVGAVMLLPAAKTDPNPMDRTPSFFRDGTYASQLFPDENVLVITDANGEEMAWQETAHFAFRMPEGYIGALPDAYASPRLFRGLAVHDKLPFVPGPDELKRFMREREVGAIVMDDLARPTFETAVRSAGYAPVYEGGGVSVWRNGSTAGTTAGG
ncbi:MAG TPA: hypothetical protein VK646_04585 [Actinomycetota bacterium]|nr:hypothetical protein [Actinomycetota bacterium]